MAKLTAPEIRKLIKAHNVLTKITIPKGANRDDLIKLVEKKGYTVDHENKKISRTVGGKTETVTLKEAEIIGKPKEKTALQKQKAAEKKEEKVVVQKKKERELKKEAVKKATKDMVPKTKPPQKIGAKPVPQKKEKKKFPTEGAKKVGEAIKKRKEEAAKKKAQAKAPAPTPKSTVAKKPRRQLKETKKPTGSDVVQPGMPKDVKIEEKKKKEKKKFPTEGAKKVGEAIKAKKVKLLTSKEYELLTRKAVKDITPTEKAQMKKYEGTSAKKEDKEKPLFEEKIETPEEKFLRFLNTVGVILGKSQTGDKGALEFTNNRKVKRVMKVLEPIVENKKTSKFTKKEKEGIKDALNYYIKSISPERKEDHKVFTQMVKNIEDYNSVTGKAKEGSDTKKGEPRMKGGLISMIMESEGEAKTILENILKKYNSLTKEQKEKNRLALDNKLFDRVISFQRVNSAGDIIGGGIKALKEVQKAIDEMGSKN